MRNALKWTVVATLWVTGAATAANQDAIQPIHLPGKGEGWEVTGGVVQDRRGNLYGLVENSNKGVFIDKYNRGCGMVFRIDETANGPRCTTSLRIRTHAVAASMGLF